MTRLSTFLMLPLVALSATITQVGGGTSDELSVFEVHGGTAIFDVATNVVAIRVHGKSTSLEGHGRIRRNAEGFLIEQLEATVPVRSLNTGMGLRDDHMRKDIFTTQDGQTPDIRFVADRATCGPEDAARRAACQVAGALTFRGTSRPFTAALKMTRDGEAMRAVGDGVVKLSAYGIPQPSQLGVTTTDDVKLRFEFTARRVARQLKFTAGEGR